MKPEPSGINAQIFRPVRLPHIRDRLARHFLEEDLARTVLTQVPPTNKAWLPGTDVGRPDEFAVLQRGPVKPEYCRSFTTHIGAALADADLYRIGPEFGQLAAEAAYDLPDLNLTKEQLPGFNPQRPDDAPPAGMAFFEKPIYESSWEDEWSGQVVKGTTSVDAIGWFPVDQGVWMTMFVVPEKVMPEMPLRHIRDRVGYLLMHSPGGGLVYGSQERIQKQSPVIAQLLALWFLMQQPGVTESTAGPVDRGLARSYVRAGRRYPDVRVVDLRRRPVPEGRQAPPSGREFNVRWLVKGHWRDQAYGKGRTLRRRIYIAPHLKGPEGAPIKSHAETVYKLP